MFCTAIVTACFREHETILTSLLTWVAGQDAADVQLCEPLHGTPAVSWPRVKQTSTWQRSWTGYDKFIGCQRRSPTRWDAALCRGGTTWGGLCCSVRWRCRRSCWDRTTRTWSPSGTCWLARMNDVAELLTARDPLPMSCIAACLCVQTMSGMAIASVGAGVCSAASCKHCVCSAASCKLELKRPLPHVHACKLRDVACSVTYSSLMTQWSPPLFMLRPLTEERQPLTRTRATLQVTDAPSRPLSISSSSSSSRSSSSNSSSSSLDSSMPVAGAAAQ